MATTATTTIQSRRADSDQPYKMRAGEDPVAFRQEIASLLTCHVRTWVTAHPNLAPDDMYIIDPVEALEEGYFDELDDEATASLTSVVLDVDALDRFDVADRMHITSQARKAGQFIRLMD